MTSIISDEELSALLDGVGESEEFRPLTLYALDEASFRAVSAHSLPHGVVLLCADPQLDWQWMHWFGSTQFALYDPAQHVGRLYMTALAQAPGVLSIDEPWLESLEQAMARWSQWLAGQQILLLEDHPFQGEQIAQQIRSTGASCVLVQDGQQWALELARQPFDWLICDLALAEDDAIHLLGQSGTQTPVILLSGHDQVLIDGAARLLGEKGIPVVGAFTKPLDLARLLPILLQAYGGRPRLPTNRFRLRHIRSWEGLTLGTLGRLSDLPLASDPAWLLLGSLGMNWEALRQRLEVGGGAAERLTLLIRPQDDLLQHQEHFSLALQARLAGAELALLIDRPEYLSFELLERLPLSALLLGRRLLPMLEQEGWLESFLQRARDKELRLYLDDPYALLDSVWWEGRGFHGRW
ncbi:response regulator [Aeromonas simiae]|uniref:response regulator n=2 Tax=Aeromonas simiae TaxID=218936 RepID=UPI00266C0548|nr:response regulator [Aeromonas simiae]MDO2951496.1 response regulator [Aeromonas simiae]